MDRPGIIFGVQARKVDSPVIDYRDDAYNLTRDKAEERVANLNRINENPNIYWEVYPIYFHS